MTTYQNTSAYGLVFSWVQDPNTGRTLRLGPGETVTLQVPLEHSSLRVLKGKSVLRRATESEGEPEMESGAEPLSEPKAED